MEIMKMTTYTISSKMDDEEREQFENLVTQYGEYQGQGACLVSERQIVHGGVFGETLVGVSVDTRRDEVRGISSNGQDTYQIVSKEWQSDGRPNSGFWKVEVK
jgi:hypothetical protein